jgi:hypothetical protein
MPFETLISKLLTRLLGDYVEGLEASNLAISVMKGLVSQENLQLKGSAFESLALPVSVRAGSLGKLTLRVPWKSLRREPCVLKLERLFVVLGPAEAAPEDIAMEARRALNLKLRRLEIAELLAKDEGKYSDVTTTTTTTTTTTSSSAPPSRTSSSSSSSGSSSLLDTLLLNMEVRSGSRLLPAAEGVTDECRCMWSGCTCGTRTSGRASRAG